MFRQSTVESKMHLKLVVKKGKDIKGELSLHLQEAQWLELKQLYMLMSFPLGRVSQHSLCITSH
jgi:hypothetical protein